MSLERQPLHDWIFDHAPVTDGAAGRTGFFVEAGAHDGVGDSCSLYLERVYGWEGICIEPSAAFEHLKASRSCKIDNRCLWGKDGEEVVFRQLHDDPELSGIVSRFSDHWNRDAGPHADSVRQAISLPSLLTEHGAPPVIDVLFLDTEGSELDILRGHDWSRFEIRLIVVEHNGMESKRASVRKLLADKGYLVDSADHGRDDWFVHVAATLPTTRPFKTIELEILTACDLACFACDRMSDVTTAPSMRLEQVQRFVNESLELGWEWERIRLLGGEPTLHPQFREMVLELVRYREKFPNVFLQVLTNGLGKAAQYRGWLVGLNISLHAEAKNRGVTPEWFHNTRIVPLDRDPGIGELEPCGIFGPRGCGIGLTRHGYFLDGAGATVARVAGYDVGVMSLKDVTMDSMLEQAKVLCRVCGHWNPSDHLETEKVTITGEVTGPFWTEALAEFRKKRPTLRVYGAD